ncbi:MAG: hypothetical protein H3Z50_03945 [archaeon]|nr:hypothetical protein [archaeon]
MFSYHKPEQQKARCIFDWKRVSMHVCNYSPEKIKGSEKSNGLMEKGWISISNPTKRMIS